MPEKVRSTRTRAVSKESTRDGVHASLWHRIGRAAVLITAGLSPWVFLPFTTAPAETTKLLLVALCATVGLVALLADTIERRRLTHPGSLVSLGVLGVVITTALSSVFSLAPSLSIFGGLVLTDSFVHIVSAALLFVLTAVFMRDRRDYIRLVGAFVGGVAVACVVAILGFIGVPYVGGIIPASLSGIGFMAVLVLGIIGLVPREKLEDRGQWLLIGITALAVVTLFLINYRELWVAVAIIALLTAAFGFMRRASIAIPLSLSIIALALVLVGSRLPVLISPYIEVRPSLDSSLAPTKAVLGSRNAIIGTGPSTYSFAFSEYRPQSFNTSQFWNGRFDQAISFFATIPVTTGVLGSAAWLLIIGATIAIARRRLDDPIVAVAALTAAFTGMALLFYPGSYIQLIVGALALGVLVGSAGARREMSFSGPSSPRLFGAFLVLVVIAAGTLSGMYLIGQKYVASAYFDNGLVSASAGNVDDAVAALTHAASLDGGSDMYQRGLSQALLAKFQELSQTESPDQQQIQGAFTLAVQAAKRAVDLNPADSANWANLGGIYEGLTPYVAGMDVEAITAYDAAAQRDPRSPAWPQARARVYVALATFNISQQTPVGDAYAKAQEEITKALDLKVDYLDARFLRAQVFYLSNDIANAEAAITEVGDAYPMDADIAFQLGLLAYQNTQLTTARTEFERAMAITSNSANIRYFLGLTYSRLSQNDKALEQFRWIKERNADNQEIGTIIANLEAGRPVLDGIAPASEAPATSTTSIGEEAPTN